MINYFAWLTLTALVVFGQCPGLRVGTARRMSVGSVPTKVSVYGVGSPALSAAELSPFNLHCGDFLRLLGWWLFGNVSDPVRVRDAPQTVAGRGAG
jgi:hypothetical protein